MGNEMSARERVARALVEHDDESFDDKTEVLQEFWLETADAAIAAAVPWVSAWDRPPTEEDADASGEVLWAFANGDIDVGPWAMLHVQNLFWCRLDAIPLPVLLDHVPPSQQE